MFDLIQVHYDFLRSLQVEFTHGKWLISWLGVILNDFRCTNCVLHDILMREQENKSYCLNSPLSSALLLRSIYPKEIIGIIR